MSEMDRWLYAAACVLAPVGWGLAMVWLLSRFDHSRAGSSEASDSSTQIEYHI